MDRRHSRGQADQLPGQGGRDVRRRRSPPQQGVARHRRGDGATAWGVTEDTADPAELVEWFTLPSWQEHLRQHHRTSQAAAALQAALDGLNAQLATATGLLNGYLADRTALMTQIAGLTADIATQNGELAGLQSVRATMQANLDGLNTLLGQQNTQLGDLQTAHTATVNDIAAQTAQLQQLNLDLAGVMADQAVAQSDLNAALGLQGQYDGDMIGLQTTATDLDRKSTRLNSSHVSESRMPSSA